MTKLELNNKLAELYGLVGTHKRISGIDIIEGNIYAYDLLIDDWSRLMDLAVTNRLRIEIYEFGVWIDYKDTPLEILISDHESPQAATRFAIAMALVKLAEDKP